jgi:hypothetical protein
VVVVVVVRKNTTQPAAPTTQGRGAGAKLKARGLQNRAFCVVPGGRGLARMSTQTRQVYIIYIVGRCFGVHSVHNARILYA